MMDLKPDFGSVAAVGLLALLSFGFSGQSDPKLALVEADLAQTQKTATGELPSGGLPRYAEAVASALPGEIVQYTRYLLDQHDLLARDKAELERTYSWMDHFAKEGASPEDPTMGTLDTQAEYLTRKTNDESMELTRAEIRLTKAMGSFIVFWNETEWGSPYFAESGRRYFPVIRPDLDSRVEGVQYRACAAKIDLHESGTVELRLCALVSLAGDKTVYRLMDFEGGGIEKVIMELDAKTPAEVLADAGFHARLRRAMAIRESQRSGR